MDSTGNLFVLFGGVHIVSNVNITLQTCNVCEITHNIYKCTWTHTRSVTQESLNVMFHPCTTGMEGTHSQTLSPPHCAQGSCVLYSPLRWQTPFLTTFGPCSQVLYCAFGSNNPQSGSVTVPAACGWTPNSSSATRYSCFTSRGHLWSPFPSTRMVPQGL